MVTEGVTETGMLEVTAPTPLSMIPVPLVNTAVKSTLSPAVIVEALALKLLMTGADALSAQLKVPFSVLRRGLPRAFAVFE